MSESYTITDADGSELVIDSCSHAGARLRVTEASGSGVDSRASVCVGAERVPEAAVKLYEAAGLPAPVILERPQTPRTDVIPGLSFSVRSDGRIEVEKPASGWSADTAVIRRLAASLAILCDEADSVPDPAEVEALAGVLASAPAALDMTGIARYLLRNGVRLEARDA